MKLKIEYSEQFEDDLIELAKEEKNLPFYKEVQLFDEFKIIYPNDLKESKYAKEVEIEYEILHKRIYDFRLMDHNINELEIEYIELTKRIKLYKINYDGENIVYTNQKLKLQYNYIFKKYKFWLLDEIISKMKQEKPEWKNIIEIFTNK